MSSNAFVSSWRDRQALSFFACALLLAALVASSAVWAASADPVGRVIRTLGVVEAIAPDGSVRRLGRQDPIFEGDTLRTGGRGRAQIRFSDRGLLSLRPDTEISVDDYEYSPSAPGAGRQELNLSRGGFRTLTGRIADGNRAGYSVRTPLAVIGVRGTIYDAFQIVGGSLVLGVSDGAIEARTTAGRLARLGIDTGFNFARINADGSVDYLIAPPTELETSPGLDEGDDEDTGGDDSGDDGSSGDGGDGDGGGELGSAEESSVAEGGGEAESTAGTPTGTSTSTVVETTSDPENTGSIAQAETGTGELPTETPVLGAVLSQEQRSALITGTDVAVVVGVRASGTTPSGEPIEEGLGIGSGIGTLDAAGEPVLAGAFGASNFGTPLDFAAVTGDREALLALSDAVLTSGSGEPGALFDGARTFQPADGAAGVVWGSFAQPTQIFLGPENVASFVETQGDNDLLFLLGTPSDIADRTGRTRYELLEWRAATTGGFVARDLISDFSLDFDTGGVDGILDLSLSGQEQPELELFGYIVDVTASLDGGLLTNVTTEATLFDVAGEASLPAIAEVSGFLSGSMGEFLNLGFAYSVDGRTDLDAQGLVLLGEVPLRPLTVAERDLLTAGYGYVEAECCFNGGRVFQNRITDPRSVAPADIVIAGGGFSPFDPIFNDVPPNDVILRPDQGVVQFFNTSEIGGAELSWFELQGFSDGPGLPGGPIGVYRASTGERFTQATSELLILTGRIADIGTLTGRARYSLAGEGFLTQGFFNVQNGGFGSFVDTDASSGSDISFNVDFNTGAITNGFLRLFTDPDDAGTPFNQAFSRDGIDAAFEGSVALSNGNPFVDFVVTRGFVTDEDGDAGGSGILDLATSDMAGFFAGDGSVFNLAFNLNSAADPDDPSTFISPTNFVGTAILTRENLALSAAEQAELGLGRVFVAAECCGPDGGIGAGPAGDPRNVGGDLLLTDGRFILGINTDAMNEDLRPGDPGFLSTDVEQVARIASAFGFVRTDFPAPPGDSDLVVGGWITGSASDVFNSPLIADARTGELLETLDSTILFNAAIPTDVATLQADGRLLTFSGSSNEGFREGTGLRAIGHLATSNIFDLDPSLTPISGASASFNIDLATGRVYNGHLFSLLEIDETGDFAEEFGFEVFFNGQLAYANGNTFLDAVITDGVFNENVAVDLEASELTLFLTGDPTVTDGFLLAQGAYFLRSVTDPGLGETIQVGGTFSLGTGTYFETRLSVADTMALDSGRLGIAAYTDLSFGSPNELVNGADGLLIGRANAPTGNDFLLGANYYRSRQSFDPVTRAPLFDLDGERVLEPANTARRGFFAQPYDLIVRQDGATESLFNADVVPSRGVSFMGFEVAWGVWQSSGSTDSARIQDDPEDGFSGGILDRQLFFASVNPTPQSQIPTTGTFTYSATGGSFGSDFLGAGSGDLLLLSGSEVNLDFLDVSFDVDFSTGSINNGSIQTGYGFSTEQVVWTGSFDGFVNGAVADLELSALGVELFGTSGLQGSFSGDLANSSIGGVFTGPNAERLVGGFNFRADVGTGMSPGPFESAAGVFIVDIPTGPGQL